MSLSLRNGLLGSPGFGLRGNVVPLRGKKYPKCLYDGNTVGWYDASDLTTIIKDSGDYVSRWNDKLGSGHDLIQSTTGYKPKWYLIDGVLFDGVDDFMQYSSYTYTTANVYMVFKVISFRNIYSFFWSCMPSETGITQPALNKINTRAAGYGQNLTIFNNGVYGIVRAVITSINTTLTLNNNATSKSNLPATPNFSKFSLGASYTPWTANFQVKEVILRNVADNSTDETNIYNYLAKKHGFDLI